MISNDTPHNGWSSLRACVTLALFAGAMTAGNVAASISPSVDKADEASASTLEVSVKAPKALLWSAYDQPKESAHDLLLVLEQSQQHGLQPQRYAVDELYEALERAAEGSDLRRFDDLFTAALWTYAQDMRDGQALLRPDLAPANSDAAAAPDKQSELYQQIQSSLENDNVADFLTSLVPTLPEYEQLQAALERYQELDLLGGWEKLPANTSLKPGDSDEVVLALRTRLAINDENVDLRPLTDAQVYDASLLAAVERFQARHGLPADGEVGPKTLAALNMSAAEKVRVIEFNLNRLRQLPDELPEDYILVNIPQYELELVRADAQSLRMPVVVGSKRTPTPPMMDKIRHLVFNPYWYPPRGISVGEILPRLKREPEYLEKMGFDVLRGKKVVDASKINWKDYTWRNFPYRFRQRPGKKNSLGRVKFIFPNAHAVYLHDTPQRALFSQPDRARSHGCVRVGRPLELASALMEWDRGWSDQEVHQDLNRAKRKLRKLNERLDIYLMYLTARVDNGELRFLPDIYRHDSPVKTWREPAPAVARYLTPNVPTGSAVATRN